MKILQDSNFPGKVWGWDLAKILVFQKWNNILLRQEDYLPRQDFSLPDFKFIKKVTDYRNLIF